MNINRFNQPLGAAIPHWSPKARPSATTLAGRYCTLALWNPAAHAHELWQALQDNNPGDTWTYLPYGPFASEAELTEAMSGFHQTADTILYTILDAQTQRVLGIAGYLRIQPEHGSIEIGHVHFSKRLQKTPAATEAIYLLLAYVFDTLGYRRCEWKCHSLNQPSRKAALRFGFQFEGIFRQACVYKGYNRDTAWYSMIDSEWPVRKARFEAWLDPNNFDATGHQRLPLQRALTPNRTHAGQALMQQIFGAEAAAAVASTLGAISPAFVEFLQGTFADIYGDTTLDLKTQELIVLVSLITQKDAKPQLKSHLHAALKAGLTREEIIAMIKHLVLYVGFPTVINALLTAREVFDESAS